ncbi:MAG: outer membrane protein assembly factor BamA [Treponemataceae bacterium]
MRLRLTAVLIFLYAFTAFAQNAEEWYVGKPIKNITFEGLRNVRTEELDGIIQPFVGRIFNDALFLDLQGRLYALEYFDLIAPTAVPASADASAVILKFKVTEKPVVVHIKFEGNKGLRQNELLDVVTIKTGDVVNSMKLKVDEKALTDKYLERGYPDVSVKAETRIQDDTSMSVVFTINEGEQIALEAFQFEGNATVSERTLRGLLTLKTKSLFDAGAYQESKLVADKDAIVTYYRERGYVDAAVFDVARQSRKDAEGRNLLTLTFRVREGRQFGFGGITFEGNKIFSTERLQNLVSQKKDQTLNMKRLESDFQRVADLYYENGYIFNTINRKEIRDDNAGIISFVVSVVERSRAYVENIIIRGNKKTKESVILREIPLEPGEIFSKSKVMDGLRNLYNLQYFSAINPETPQGSTDNLMDLIFNVEEQPTADIQFGLTFSGSTDPNDFPMSGLIKWSDRNFLGNGQVFSVSLTASPETQELSFQFTERWLFGFPLSGTFDFTIGHYQKDAAQIASGTFFTGNEDYAFPYPYTSYQDYYDSDKSISDAYLMTYQKWSYSVGFSSGYRFRTPLGTLSVGGALRSALYRNQYDESLYRPFDPTLRSGNNQWLNTQTLTGSVSLDNRDLSYDPSKGTFVSQRASLVGWFPFEREHYLRTDTKAEAFLTLFDFMVKSFQVKAVLAAHSGFSMILPQFYGEPSILYSNKLALDGMFIARGWYSESTNYGLTMWENWLEIRSPLAPGVLSLDWFFDAAVVKESPQKFFSELSLSDFRFSIGAGFRFAIPQFPFRFSLAKRFKFVDGNLKWMTGSLWNDSSTAGEGLDFVLSFVVTTN